MVRAAFPYWDNRIAPVFDAAKHICLVEADAGAVIKKVKLKLPDDTPQRKAVFLAEQGVNALVCGAISKQLEEMVSEYGIKVETFRAGNLEDIIAAWLEGRIGNAAYSMPGCFGRCGGGRRGRCYGKNKEKR